jgi:prophage regulatory protein
MHTPRILRRHGLVELTKLSMATIYRLIKRREFPSPIKLSANAVGWDVQDVYAWIESRKAGQLKARAA